LPAAPLLERFLFEQPWLPMAILGVLAVVAVIAFAGRNQRRRGLIVAGTLVAAAAGVYLVSTLVTTERERLLERTRVAIGAVAAVDVAMLREVLSDNVFLRSDGDIARVQPSIDGRDAIIDQVERQLGNRFRITSWDVHDRQATLDGPNTARTLVRVGVDGDNFSRTHYSWWRLHWERGPDGVWRCFELEPLWIQFLGSA
jgi:hypothetical protein